jgi:eukaryotic-like serine/threonine-protein kinase
MNDSSESGSHSQPLSISTIVREDLEDCIRRFQQAWNGDRIPQLTTFLPTGNPVERVETLLELIKVDLENRWNRQPGVVPASDHRPFPWRPLLEDYWWRFHEEIRSLVPPMTAPPLDLILLEYRVRMKCGDQPTKESYAARFPKGGNELYRGMVSIEAEQAAYVIDLYKSQIANLSTIPSKDFALPGRCGLNAGDQIDDFRLISELGQGAFARVFLAQQISMQRLVALKISERESFESPVLSQLDHPNIVRVFDERRVDGMHLMYMQYVDGGCLRAIIDRIEDSGDAIKTGKTYLQALATTDKTLTVATRDTPNADLFASMDWSCTVAWIGARLADALAHSHAMRVLHRDIKPANILLASDGRPLLADFNLSFGKGLEGASPEKMFGGTLAYMPPEQLSVLMGHADVSLVDERSDIFSLGVVLWELLYGVRPFPESDPTGLKTTFEEQLTKRSLGPMQTNASQKVHVQLHQILVQCMHGDKEQRPATAALLTRQLQQCTIAPLQPLLAPTQKSLRSRWARSPRAWLLSLGLLPNLLLSPLNIWANSRLALDNFDRNFFHMVEEPVVNLVAFPLGLGLSLWIANPIFAALFQLKANGKLDESVRQLSAERCLSVPGYVAAVVFSLWAGSGLVFPIWNRWSILSEVGIYDMLGFLLSQILHGLIASGISLVLVSLVIIESHYPKLMSQEASVDEQNQLTELNDQLRRMINFLAITPLLAILAIALSEQIDKSVFVALACLGFCSHLVTAYVVPRISRNIHWLRIALSPTHELLKSH